MTTADLDAANARAEKSDDAVADDWWTMVMGTGLRWTDEQLGQFRARPRNPPSRRADAPMAQCLHSAGLRPL